MTKKLITSSSGCEQTAFSNSKNFYAQWRLRTGSATVLHDGQDPPPERLLQAVWQHQRLRRDQLRTLDGATVRVLHPGFGNVEGGPDFRKALIQIGKQPPRTCDVEIDLHPGDWHAHGHDCNPAFQNVGLHVLWACTASPQHSMPVLPIGKSLDAPVGELSLWLENEPAKSLPELFQGRCSAPLRTLDTPQLEDLLNQAAQTRLLTKATHFHARAKSAGWEQALWEGLFRALGYKHNTWPMLCLAETREQWSDNATSPFELQARLLGVSGLLPGDMRPKSTDNFIRRAWDCWWRERDRLESCSLPGNAWRFHGLRPANHPQRRLALAAHWLASGELSSKLESWCASQWKDNQLLPSLTEALQVAEDDYWSWHWTLRSARLQKAQPLLGERRVTDLAINVILPWLWIRAGEGRNLKLQTEMERRYFAWPAGEDNSVLKLARQRLLGGAVVTATMRRASAQQGLLQIVRDFCEQSNAVCDQCLFPELVRNSRLKGSQIGSA